MGTVYEAEQIATGRRVALKILRRDLDSHEMRQRFLREGQLAAGVRHPNSLYVFGTEEIEGHPVITMEIAGGGTLADALRQDGPLAITRAVDATLDVISGLEAASSAGVLHRDVKPSNCFVSADGSVKIGDFGLSVSTLARDDTQWTGTGVIVGTPAFASPEQLRGQMLDVRADIYSVGASLFALLTGRPPIEGRHAIEVVAAALEEEPQALNGRRDDVPAELARVVARCLAKQPGQRFADYALLRAALLPFSSTRPTPAPIGRRLFAGFVDVAVCGIIPAVSLHAFFAFDIDDRVLFTERSQSQLLAWLTLALFYALYHAVLEGLWGTTFGKALMGLRVARPDGQMPGFARAVARGGISTLTGNVGKVVCFIAISPQQFAAGGAILVGAINVIALLAFATMRRRNGLATVWDLATDSRVVNRTNGALRPTTVARDEGDDQPVTIGTIGPYSVVQEIQPSRWIAATDEALRRRVWLRRRTTEISRERRDVARLGRNRWLQSVAASDTTWDAFEAPPGVALSELGGAEGLSWDRLRYWLYDLASEIAAAAIDHTLPEALGCDHVWITSQGRVVLLDEPWPSACDPDEPTPVADLDGQQRFLHGIAAAVQPETVPLHARPVLRSLAKHSFEEHNALVGSLRSLLARPATLDRAVRATSLLALPLFLTTFVCLIVMGDRAAGGSMSERNGLPDFMLLPVLTLFALIACLAVPQLLTSIALRATPGQFLFGFTVVDASGAVATRSRLVVRWAIAWATPIAVFLSIPVIASAGLEAWYFLLLLAALLPWIAGVIVAIRQPARGPHDVLTGCWLVPR